MNEPGMVTISTGTLRESGDDYYPNRNAERTLDDYYLNRNAERTLDDYYLNRNAERILGVFNWVFIRKIF